MFPLVQACPVRVYTLVVEKEFRFGFPFLDSPTPCGKILFRHHREVEETYEHISRSGRILLKGFSLACDKRYPTFCIGFGNRHDRLYISVLVYTAISPQLLFPVYGCGMDKFLQQFVVIGIIYPFHPSTEYQVLLVFHRCGQRIAVLELYPHLISFASPHVACAAVPNGRVPVEQVVLIRWSNIAYHCHDSGDEGCFRASVEYDFAIRHILSQEA